MGTLKYAILGLLNRNEMTGYELSKEFETTLFEFWNAKHSQIYPELKSLNAEGLIQYRVEITGNVLEKKVYTITDEGRRDFIKRRPRDDRRHRCAVRGAGKRKACGRGRGRDRPGAAARRSPAVEDGKCGHHTAYLRRIPFAGDARPHCAYYGGEFKAFSGG